MPFSFVVVGHESLTTACLEHLLQRSHDVKAIVSDSNDVTSWAKEKNLNVIEFDDLIKLRNIDYLLSIANLKIFDSMHLSFVNRSAINFHDGPLPEIKGVNNPSWAIRHQFKEYGVTWHEISSSIDQGDIIVAERFNIAPDETSVSLNTKCFHAGYRTFQKLLAKIESDNVDPIRQKDNFSHTKFSRWKRPEANSCLNFNSSAEQIEAEVRSLIFKPYQNIMGTPKVLLPEGLISIGKVAILSEQSGTTPGKLIEVQRNSLRVTTKSNDIKIMQLYDLSAQPIPLNNDRLHPNSESSIEVEEILPWFETTEIKELDSLVRQSAKAESYWIEQFKNFQFLELSGSQNAVNEYQSKIVLPKNFKSSSSKIASIILYLGRLYDTQKLSLWIQRELGINRKFENQFLNGYPINAQIDWDSTVNEFLDQIEELIRTSEDKGLILSDIGLRYPSHNNAFKKIKANPICEIRSLDVNDHSFQFGTKTDGLKLYIDDFNNCIHIATKGVFQEKEFDDFVRRFGAFCFNLSDNSTEELRNIEFLSADDKDVIAKLNQANTLFKPSTIVESFQQQAKKTPNQCAIKFRDEAKSYSELDFESNRIAVSLVERGINPGDFVGILMEPSINLVPALLGVQKAGAAYVPLDPAYPEERLKYMIDNCQPKFVLADKMPTWVDRNSSIVLYEDLKTVSKSIIDHRDLSAPSGLMYLIYTSGSTGNPKGVQVRHENVQNFFQGIDERINSKPGTVLCTTSISFDISVLEIFWTICRGGTAVLYKDQVNNSSSTNKNIGFSLFFWNLAERVSKENAPYNLLLQASEYADENDFEAVWTPERHFGDFGGYYPNPSVISAAVAARTSHISIRAGSCVIPLHNPIRVAEDWSVVDNLSNGRVGISIAPGWNPNDFVLNPNNFKNSKEIMYKNIELIRELWRGKKVEFEGPNGKVAVGTLPKPIQSDLPIWITAAANPETFKIAGKKGANILTHLLGQSIDQVKSNIQIYRNEWRNSGHDGEGHATIMLHTFVSDDEKEAKSEAREPLKNYLRSSLVLIKDAAWQFPTFKKFSEDGQKTLDDYFEQADPQEIDDLLEFAFERYYNNGSLIGSVNKCTNLVNQLKAIGVDEIGCLIDFGIDEDKVASHLKFLNDLRILSNQFEEEELSITQSMIINNVTHYQCTPSQAFMLLHESDVSEALSNLEVLMLGGEPLSDDLVQRVKEYTSANIYNMYGPTETTIWSTVAKVDETKDANCIGTPLTNQSVHILDKNGFNVPPGSIGELAVGGAGVTNGYYNKEELTLERFVKISDFEGREVESYKTGDLVKLDIDGKIRFIGRLDDQVKVRGYRIELGDIDTHIRKIKGINEVATVVQKKNLPDARIVAFYTSENGIGLSNKINESLHNHLPQFMIPSNFVLIPKLPYLPNGKLDRNTLEHHEFELNARENIVPPSNDTEQMIADIWSSLLKVDSVCISDNFFELGGHSLLAIQAIDKIERSLGIRISPRKILTNTLEQLAADCISIQSTKANSESNFLGRFFSR